MTGWNDPNGTAGGPIITNVVPTPPYNWGTYPERLEEAGISWQVYQEEDDYGTNVLEYFQNFQNAEPGSGLYERGLTISQPGKFEADCAAGNLPTVTWIVPTSGKSEHPAYLPATGADWLASKIEAVAANPDLWEQTLFILNYDENDGLFDHVPPPLPPAGTPDEFVSLQSAARRCRADRRRRPGPVHPDLAVDGRRLRRDRELRPHLGAAAAGADHRRRRSRTSPSGGATRSAI